MSTSSFTHWPEIVSFYNIKKFVAAYPANVTGNGIVLYRNKVKLHGVNSAVRVDPDYTVTAQSRSKDITPEDDNCGFARQVKETEFYWKSLLRVEESIVVYGEWCGKSVQSGCAIHEILAKQFCVFAISFLNKDGKLIDHLVVEPGEIRELLKLEEFKEVLAWVHVLPWYDSPFEVSWFKTVEELETTVIPFLNEEVLRIEACDPWVKETFGIEGVGEGMVSFPVSHPGRENFKNLAFKSKGEKHRTVRQNKAVSASAPKVEGVLEFCRMVLTEARLEQGVANVPGGFEKKNTGKFIGWISQDVHKECQEELKGSGLTWEQVTGMIANTARSWFMEKCK